MASSFGEYALPTDTLAAILAAYPFSIGLFRELLQNSDDARASKQVFVLDKRTFGTATLVDTHAKLRGTQGPAVLAYNDALFEDGDWEALQSIHRSSKKTDTSKIGKYGIGFRSCYHITDNPEILSGPHLAILDPHHYFAPTGGVKVDFTAQDAQYHDQLDAFEFFLPSDSRTQPFSGSIIRLPLRLPGAESSISSKSVDASEIRQLFDDFVREEIGISLLFLKHVREVEVHEISEDGTKRCLARTSIRRDQGRTVAGTNQDQHHSFKCTVSVDSAAHGQSDKPWRIVHSFYPEAQSTSLLALRIGQDPRPILAKHKLLSEMAVAIPLSIVEASESDGRLFTYLPLPLKTGFPVHVHALFALTQSRQNLNNGGEVGIVKGSADSILVEWNHILFENFLPCTWAILLQALLQEDALEHVFRAWPSEQAVVFGGDSAYWQSLPAKLLSHIIASASPVWPLVGGSFAVLDASVLVTGADTDAETLAALTNAGLRITQLPQYILRLLGGSQARYVTLSPKMAYQQLCGHQTEIHALDSDSRLVVLRYLVRDKVLDYIADLPLVPLVNGGFVTLKRRSETTSKVYTMMEQGEADVFKQMDELAIALSSLPQQAIDVLRTSGPALLNVSILTPAIVASYLQSSPLGFDLTKRTDGKLSYPLFFWLTAFWSWLGTWHARNDLYPLVSSLYLVPTHNGVEAPAVGVFTDAGIDPGLVPIYKSLGLSLLHASFSDDALKGLSEYPLVLKSLSDIHLVLDRITLTAGLALELQPVQAHALSKHMVDCVLQLGSQTPLTPTQTQKLRSLPIFPLLSATTEPPSPEKSYSVFRLPTLHRRAKSVAAPVILQSIPDDTLVVGVPGTEDTSALIPDVAKYAFLDGANADLHLLQHLTPSKVVPLTAPDLLEIAVEHFAAQTKTLRAALLEHLVKSRASLPPSLFETLRDTEFVQVANGRMQAPRRVIDPSKTDLVALFSDDKSRIPVLHPDDAPIISQLRQLDLLISALDVDIVRERIAYISSRSEVAESRTLAVQMLSLIHATSSLDCSTLEISPELRWLPTNRGLVGSADCYDHVMQIELFDEVLAVLDRNAPVSPSLRVALKWDRPVSFDILLSQLRTIAHSGQPSTLKLDRLIRELSTRALDDKQVEVLQEIVSEKRWIPIASNLVVKTEHAVFQSTSGLPGFHQIPFGLGDRPETKAFLSKMGCTDRPSAPILLTELKSLEARSRSRDIVNQALLVLAALAADLKSVSRSDLLVPDTTGILRPISQVYFNDVGERACLIDLGTATHIAHPKLSDDLSKQLLMDRLGFKSVELSPGIDMGETLTTTIRNTLKQYSEAQICSEFLANAADAGASSFAIMVDEKNAPTEKLLAGSMAAFQTGGALVLWNSGVFTSKDFDGICRTGVGGKEGKTNTIGQFGLGALSMFHFTEMAMVVSGSQVLFLDPSKSHLPIQGRASLLLPLEQLKRWYPDHLQAIQGLFGFNINSKAAYNGTIFRLPFRRNAHLNPNSIISNVTKYTTQYIRERILRPWYETAKLSLLFTKLERISTSCRTAAGRETADWSISAFHEPAKAVFNFRTHIVHVKFEDSRSTDDYRVVSTAMPLKDIPSEFLPLIEPHRLRSPVVVGMAAPMDASTSPITNTQRSRLFSTLPLPMSTSLPVHVTASFILTPDRRHIRLDDYANLESKYNSWLLATVAPPLYLFLLEDLLRGRMSNGQWWPGNYAGQHEDPVSKHLLDAFYSAAHLGTTKRRICASVFEAGEQLKPSEVLLGWDEPGCVTKILSRLNAPHVVMLPQKVRERCAAVMKKVDQTLVREELLAKTRSFVGLYSKGEINVKDIEGLVEFLAKDQLGKWAGLPLVPLRDGKLGTLALQATTTTNFHVWKPVFPDRVLFPAEFLVQPEFGVVAEKAWPKSTSLNVVKLDYLGIEQLLKEQLSNSDEKQLKPEDEAWVQLFWAEYPHFGIDPKNNNTMQLRYPLVRTTKPGQYISLSKCWTNSVLIATSNDPAWLCAALTDLGACVVQRENKELLPKALRELLKSQQSMNFERVLDYFQTVESSLSSRFAKLDPALHAQLAEWARGKTVSTPERLIPIASQLPIWKKLQRGSSDQKPQLHTAMDLKMLPFGIGKDVASRFMGVPTVEHNVSLVHLKVTPMPFNQFWYHLKLPQKLTVEDQTVYKQLLGVLPANFTFNGDSILVPNGNRDLVKANTLYARHALFIAAFGSDLSAEHFILDSFRDLEPRLVPLGLKSHSNLDFDMFSVCARAIQAEMDKPQIIARARVVFRAYGEDMSLRMERGGWKTFDEFRFIPRETLRRRTMGIENSSRYVKPIPRLMTPSESLLADHEAVCWTQRGVLLESPHERLLVANPTFGQPTAREVVEHLRVLALQVAQDLPSDIYVLSDLQATYEWLDDHQHLAEEIIVEMHDQPLFLNVDDPRTERWVWHCADEMFFNILDGGDLKSVKKFLVPWRDLLSVAGVDDIVNAPVPATERSSVETQLQMLRDGFQSMRVQGLLTDVVFVSEPTSTDAEDGTRFPAHRAFLAPMSEYLNDLFCGSFTESGPGTADDPIEVDLEYSALTVEAVLDFMYQAKAPSVEKLADLLDLMDLSNYWGLSELCQLVQAKIISNNQISPATYEEVLARATALDAALLLAACTFFENANRDAILRLKGEATGKRRESRRIPIKAGSASRKSMAVSETSSSSGSRLLSLKPPTAKKVAKGFFKGLRKVGDSWDFLS
ncbi:unnamed protein product [Mycena citricolor]|uniref:BTB domain-containing protein n=1 Tax=Mycena citricolor TaxID=2018698 RepID=A0AAD2HNR8_9AGAR|nr:unnamed protein product [Mycena citricolor]